MWGTLGRLHAVNHAGVNLPHRDRRPQSAIFMDGAEALEEQSPVLADRLACVLRRDAQIQRTSTVGFGYATPTRAEAMQKPGDAGQSFGRDHLQFPRAAPRLRRPHLNYQATKLFDYQIAFPLPIRHL